MGESRTPRLLLHRRVLGDESRGGIFLRNAHTCSLVPQEMMELCRQPKWVGMLRPIPQPPLRGATLLETTVCVVIVAIISYVAIAQFGSSIRTKIRGDLVVSLGGKAESSVAGVGSNDKTSSSLTTGRSKGPQTGATSSVTIT
jgi:hypothetical protein